MATTPAEREAEIQGRAEALAASNADLERSNEELEFVRRGMRGPIRASRAR